MQSFRDLARTSHKKSNVPKGLDTKTIFFLFEKIIAREYGKRGRTAIELVYFKEGRLGIRTVNPLWANELWLTQSGLVAKLNEEIGESLVTELKLLQ